MKLLETMMMINDSDDSERKNKINNMMGTKNVESFEKNAM
jgi:hypothetical protein